MGEVNGDKMDSQFLEYDTLNGMKTWELKYYNLEE
jgi:hypothetical protein